MGSGLAIVNNKIEEDENCSQKYKAEKANVDSWVTIMCINLFCNRILEEEI